MWSTIALIIRLLLEVLHYVDKRDENEARKARDLLVGRSALAKRDIDELLQEARKRGIVGRDR